MTSINFENSSVVLSWGALVGSIRNRNIMQENFYSSVANSTNMALSLSKEQAGQQEKEMNANASQTQTQAIGSIVGGAASGVVAGVSGWRANSCYNQAGTSATGSEFGAGPRSGNASTDAAPANTPGAIKTVSQNEPGTTTDTIGKTPTAPKTQNTPNYQANGDFWTHNGSTFASGASSIASGISNVVSVKSIQEQGQAKAAQTIAAAIAQLENSLASTMTATQQGLDSANGSTNQTLSTMIGVCASA